jgi:hypothetical protein
MHRPDTCATVRLVKIGPNSITANHWSQIMQSSPRLSVEQEQPPLVISPWPIPHPYQRLKVVADFIGIELLVYGNKAQFRYWA